MLKSIDIPTEQLHLKVKEISTRLDFLGSDGPAYFREFSGIDLNYPDSVNIWNQLPYYICP